MIIKLIAKAILLPVQLVLVVLQWIGTFLDGISGLVFGVLSVILAIAAAACFFLGQDSTEAIRILAAAFVTFCIPHVVGWIVLKLAILRALISEFMHS